MDERVARLRHKASWRKPLLFACWAALGGLLGAAVGEMWLGLTAPPPAPPPPPPPRAPKPVDQAVVLVLDTSFSMWLGQLGEMKQAALAYVSRQNLAHTRIAVVHFGSEAELTTGLTRDRAVLEAAINSLSVDGSTQMDAGIQLGQDQLAMAPEKRNLLLFTDGMPNDSDLTSRTAEAVRRSQTRLIAIATGSADTSYLAQLTGDPALVFRAESGSYGEAFKKAERAIAPEVAPTTKMMTESAPAESGGSGLALMRTAVWTGILGFFVTAALIGAQKKYARQTFASGDAVAMLGGFFAGGAAGAAGQIFFEAASIAPGLELGGRIVAWTLLGSGLGAGMALFIPNLRADRAALGGAAGGALGAVGFVAAAALAGDGSGRWLGAAAVGFCIGLMLVLAEMVFRKAWLHVSYGPADSYDMNLGEIPIGVGSDRTRCRIFVRESPPLIGRYGLRAGQLYYEDAAGARTNIQPGDERAYGRMTITVHAERAMAVPALPAHTPWPPAPGGVQAPALPLVGPPPAIPQPVVPVWPMGPAVHDEPAPAASAPPYPAAAAAATVVQGSVASGAVRNPWLLVDAGVAVPLPFGAEVTLGRGGENRVIVNDDSVSTHHAALRVTRGELTITDLGSTNGTYVNGFRIPENKPFGVEIGDTVIMGHRVFGVERGEEE